MAVSGYALEFHLQKATPTDFRFAHPCSVDPFSRKDWYDVKAPSVFKIRQVGKTLVNRTQGTKIASEGLKGRVFEVSLADLNQDEDQAFRNMRLVCEDVQGKNVLTNFHGTCACIHAGGYLCLREGC